MVSRDLRRFVPSSASGLERTREDWSGTRNVPPACQEFLKFRAWKLPVTRESFRAAGQTFAVFLVLVLARRGSSRAGSILSVVAIAWILSSVGV